MANLVFCYNNFRQFSRLINRQFFSFSKNTESQCLKRFTPTTTIIHLQSKRNLFSDEVLGVDRFVQLRQQISQRFGQQKQIFFDRLTEHIADEKNAILSEDLKNLLFLCENSDNHIDLLRRTIDKFEKQNESLRFGLFQFGPIVMRLARHLNNVDMAMWIFNPKYKNFFTQISSVTIAMDILLENGHYQDVIKLFDYATTKFDFDVKYPIDFVVLYFAACYKLNTVESFESAFRVLRSIQMSNDHQIKLRGLYCFIALAIKQNHPNIALEIIQNLNSKSMKSMNIIIQSLRLLALSRINRLNDVADIIQFQLNKDKPKKNQIIFNDVMIEIRTVIEKSGKPELIEKINGLIKQLEESNMIEMKRALDDALMSTINFQRQRKFPNQQSTNDADGGDVDTEQQQPRPRQQWNR
uniref:Pentatricopeptide repeat-containing protein 2, mitochondrial-like n=2 Tax=Dermatophagoides pteronyssinus TaxID=6956 RepID=A0A6P6XVD8_DERPT|nr:pentatricopeptide repeat-containing protein 2, mitochondrial-like [Dermatophagoides pteronyssinus]